MMRCVDGDHASKASHDAQGAISSPALPGGNVPSVPVWPPFGQAPGRLGGPRRMSAAAGERIAAGRVAHLFLNQKSQGMYGHTAQAYGTSERMNILAQLVCSRVRAEIFRVLFGLGAEQLVSAA